MAVLRSRRGAVLAKIETTEGVDAAPTTTNAMLVENPRISFDASMVTTNEMTGSLDPRAPIPGGIKMSMQYDMYLKGSGTPGVAPEFGDLFKACGWEEVVTAVAIGTEPAATGSTTSVTLGTSGAATAQAYRGMPITLSGNPVTPSNTFITDYSAAKVATLANLFGTPLNSSTEYTIPANVLYRPTSDETVIKSLTQYCYMDGVLYKMLGARGTFALTMVAGQPGKLSFQWSGIYGGKTDAAVPVISSFDTTRPPIWRNPNGDGAGHFSIERAQAALRQLVLTNGANLVNPDDPNAQEGFQTAVIPSRRMVGTMDPLATLVATRNLMDDFRNGVPRILHSRIGTAAGNRCGIVIPAAFQEQNAPGDRDGLGTEEVSFFCEGEDAGAFMCFW